MNREFCNVSMPIMIAMVLSACGNGYSSTPGKIAATVNGEAIAVYQIKSPGQLASRQVSPGPAALEALDKLIDQELLAQKAAAMRLDRDAAVVREIEAAKQKILAQSYVDRSIPKHGITPDEIVAYYRAHPTRFEQRRSYRLNELVTTVSPEHLAQFKLKVAGGGRLDDFADWLQHRRLPFLMLNSIKFSEQLPADVLPRIATLRGGQIALLEVPGVAGSLSVVQLLQAQDAPLSLEEAKPLITNLLLEQKRQKFAQTKARQLRASARVEYLGVFAEAKNSALAVSPDNKSSVEKNDPYFFKALLGLL